MTLSQSMGSFVYVVIGFCITALTLPVYIMLFDLKKASPLLAALIGLVVGVAIGFYADWAFYRPISFFPRPGSLSLEPSAVFDELPPQSLFQCWVREHK